MTPEEIVSELSGYTTEQLEIFRKRMMEQKYSGAKAAPFINSRMLNFWVEENKLLEKWEEKGWRKFSFTELVWLKIINDLRNFGLNFEIIRKLKEDLFMIYDSKLIADVLKKKKREFEKILTKLESPTDKKLAEFLVKFDAIRGDLAPPTYNILFSYIMAAALFRTPVSLLVNIKGEHMLIAEKYLSLGLRNRDNRDFFFQSHISVSLTEIIEHFILKEKIDDQLVPAILTEDELMIMEIIRKERPRSLNIRFNDQDKIDLIEVIKNKKIDLASRFLDIIIKDGYETITLKTQAGKIVTCSSNKKIKPR